MPHDATASEAECRNAWHASRVSASRVPAEQSRAAVASEASRSSAGTQAGVSSAGRTDPSADTAASRTGSGSFAVRSATSASTETTSDGPPVRAAQPSSRDRARPRRRASPVSAASRSVSAASAYGR
ncbi:MAG TPA: hypothetical protein VGI96_22120 [Streptosporangiaceae bacterium]